MLPVSAMSDAANKLRNLLLDRIDDLDDVNRIRIGHPKSTFEDMKKEMNHLNLFFYNVSYDGYPADGLSEDPFYVRLHCLITAVGAKKEGSPSAGENDLRLIGEVMRVLHEQPVISVDGGNNSEIAQLQIVPHPLNLDNLNHIWSTQGDTAYRLSVAYEMALAPIPLAEAVERSSLVGDIGTSAQPDLDQEPLPAGGFGIPVSGPSVPETRVDTSRSNWTPHVSFVYRNACAYTLAFKKGSQALTDFIPRIWVATDPNARIDLVWERWQSDSGWRVVSRRKDILSVALAIHLGSTIMYAGTTADGVFKSVDSGNNWTQKSAGQEDLNVQCIAIDPGTPTTVYAGTNAGGVFKSDDGGENWVQKSTGLGDLNVQFIAIDPGTPTTVYAGTTADGVFKSVVSGNNWTQKSAGQEDLNVQFIAIDSGTPTTVYAGTTADGVFKSVDSGNNWTQKSTGLSDLNVQFLAIDPGTPTTVYAGTNGGGVFKSDDGGENWVQKSKGLGILNVQFLAMDPGTPTTVYAGTNSGGVFKSVDSGENWSHISRIPIGLNDDVLTIAPETAESAETFQESMPDKLSPGQAMLYAVRIYKRSQDGVVTEARSNPLLVTVFEAGA
jgi:photosystem II stability/assembly factor-like uncharacterized protein